MQIWFQKKCFVGFCCWAYFPTMPFLISLDNHKNWIKFNANDRAPNQTNPTIVKSHQFCVCFWDVHIRRDCSKKKKFETTFVNNLLLFQIAKHLSFNRKSVSKFCFELASLKKSKQIDSFQSLLHNFVVSSFCK